MLMLLLFNHHYISLMPKMERNTLVKLVCLLPFFIAFLDEVAQMG